MSERIPMDELNSDQLDALYDRIATLESVAAGNKRHVQLIVPDLERAEEAVARAYALADRWQAAHGSAQFLVRVAGAELREVLEEAAAPCEQHPNAPVIGGLCGGCTVYPADMVKEG